MVRDGPRRRSGLGGEMVAGEDAGDVEVAGVRGEEGVGGEWNGMVGEGLRCDGENRPSSVAPAPDPTLLSLLTEIPSLLLQSTPNLQKILQRCSKPHPSQTLEILHRLRLDPHLSRSLQQ